MENSISFKTFLAVVFYAVILFGSLLSSAVDAGVNQWTSNGPYGGYVSTFAIGGNGVIYAGGTGVFKSTDGGNNWSCIGLIDIGIGKLVIASTQPNTIYASSYGSGVFKSTDGGVTWSTANTGLPNLNVTTLAIDPLGAPIWAGTDVGVFKSTDGGATWKATGGGNAAGTGPTYITAIVMDTYNGIYVSTWSYGGVYKSTDGGYAWHAANTGLPNLNVITTLAIDPSGPIYAGTYGAGVFKSTDGGTTWNAVNTGLTTVLNPIDVPTLEVDALAIDTSGNIYASTNEAGVFKSTDRGATWARVNTGLPAYPFVGPLAIDPWSNTVYAGADVAGGVFKSTDGGATWSAVNTGLNDLGVVRLAIDPTLSNTVYAGTWGAGVFKSTDGGAAWSAVNTGLPDPFFVQGLAIDPTAHNRVYSGDVGVFKSTDGGNNWSAVGTNLGVINNLVIDPTSNVYALEASQGVIKSTDGGAAWSVVTGLTNLNVNTLAIDPTTSTTIYAGTFGTGVIKSTDGGATWTAVNTGLLSLNVNTLAIDPTRSDTIYAGTYQAAGVCKSTDGGATWSVVTGLTNLNVNTLAIDPTCSNTIYASTYGAGVFKSTDRGATWNAMNTGLPSLNVGPVAISADGQILYAGTWHGVFSYETVTYTVTPSPVQNGSISPSTPQTVKDGCGTTFEIVPNTNYHIASVTGCGGTLSGNTYTTGLITADCFVSASFAINDTTPPITTVSLSPSPNGAGWNNTNVTVTLTSADEPGGLGVKSITYTLSGAQTGGGSVSGSTASFTISTEGTTVVSYYGQDNAGNIEATKNLGVKIDKTPPVLTVPSKITANATSPAGAVVTYSVTATDNLDPNPIVSCTPASGSTFPIGTTTVNCNASDAAGNSSTASFQVQVVVPDFSLSPVSPITATVGGPAATATVTVNAINGFNSPVTLTVSGLPSGVSATFNPVSVNPSGSAVSSTLSVSLTPSVTPSTFTLQITGTSGQLTHSTSVSITVTTTSSGITSVIGQLLTSGAITNSGIANALTSKLSNAQAAISAGQINTAINILVAFINQVQAQSGKHILSSFTLGGVTFNPAAVLISDITALIANLKVSMVANPILGNVVDSNGSGISGATVRIVDSAGSVVATATTDATGFYFFATTGVLTTGSTYTVQVTASGFTTSTPASQAFTWGGTAITLGNFVLS